MSVAKPKPFRVVVAGGGIAGLAMSHALQLAKIDHVVLEAYPEIVSHVGASIGLWPNGIRVLDQMDATVTSVGRLADLIKDRHGYDFVVLERQHVIKALYDNLPDKSYVHTQKRVKNVIQTAEGVQVETEDNTSYEGDIVVGCDGVNSLVRDFMWESANKAVPGSISAAEKSSLVTTYSCLIGFAPEIAGIGMGDCQTVHNHGFSFLIITQPGRTFFFVFIKLPQVVRWPNRSHFTAEDADREAAKLMDLPVTESVVFGEIWNRRLRGQLIPLEEVVFDHWHHNRIAILGDSAHKLTINLAFGGNSALESTAALVNLLNKELTAHPDRKMSQQTISTIFENYQELRKPRMKQVLKLAYQLTRLQAWDGPLMKMLQTYVIPWVGDRRAADYFALLVKGGVKLDYVPLPPHVKGSVEFDDLYTKPETKSSLSGKGFRMMRWMFMLRPLLLLVASAVFVGSFVFRSFLSI